MILELSKPKRTENREYLDWVKSQPCVVGHGCYGPTDPDHLKTVGSGGTDYSAIPMCRKHHTDRHQYGRVKFERETGVDMWHEAWGLLHQWITRSPK